MDTSSIALTKPSLKTAMAESLYNELLANTSNYYYFMGKTLQWDNTSDLPLAPDASNAYENEARQEMIFLKKITTADIAYSIPRYNWQSGIVYDMYDDRLGEVVNVSNCSAGAGAAYITGVFDPAAIPIGYSVSGTGIAVGTKVVAVAGDRVGIDTVTIGTVSGTVQFTNISTTGATSLDSAKFYCVNSDYNVYKCLYNNGGAPSTVRPYATSHLILTTSDGYKWKYMYTIPSAMVTRFVTSDDIPVNTSLKDQYYSRGSITSATILNYGRDYGPGDYLVVTGNGNLKDNIWRLMGINLDDPGAGYTFTPTVSVTEPYDAVDWTASTFYLAGQYIKFDQRIYVAAADGTSGLYPPTHTSTEPVLNGKLALRFVGLSVIPQITITNGSVSQASMTGILGYLNLAVVGSGYDSANPPLVHITDPVGSGTGAHAVANVSSAGYVSGFTITDRGSGYSAMEIIIDPPTSGVPAVANADLYYGYGYSVPPTITVQDPYEATLAWESNVPVNHNDIVQSAKSFYKVTTTGSGLHLGSSPPTHNSGSAANGNVQLLFLGRTPSLSMGVMQTAAKIVPVIESGQIVNVIIDDPGVGYTTANIKAYGAGTEAVVVPNLSVGDANTNQSTVELLAVPGTIEVILVTNPGSGYVSGNAKVVVNGDGSGCTAEAIVVDGVVDHINVLTPGSNYTKASVTIIGNEGAVQAYARAIVSPIQGHGKNSVRELCAQNLIMSTTVTMDKNLGFTVTNDYRQLGIIKNPTEYSSNRRFTQITGSSCYSIVGYFMYTEINNDDIILDDIGNEYRVVAKPTDDPGTGIIDLLVQSLSNVAPTIGQAFYYTDLSGNTQYAVITGVTYPDVNKYSGDILFIDNRSQFKPSTEQTISVKTSIRF